MTTLPVAYVVPLCHVVNPVYTTVGAGKPDVACPQIGIPGMVDNSKASDRINFFIVLSS